MTGDAVRQRMLDLVFLIGVLFKGIDGIAELIGGIVLLILSPGQLLAAIIAVTGEELVEDPHDVIVNLVLHGVGHLDTGTTTFVALYLLLHGVVKLAIVGALLLGTRRIYPWAIAGLVAFLAYQLYLVVVAPSATVIILTVFDAAIIALTWREWRHGHTLRETWRSTARWVFRRAPASQQ